MLNMGQTFSNMRMIDSLFIHLFMCLSQRDISPQDYTFFIPHFFSYIVLENYPFIFRWENPKKRVHMEAPDVNALRLMLVLQKKDEMAWNGFMWPRLWARCRFFLKHQ